MDSSQLPDDLRASLAELELELSEGKFESFRNVCWFKKKKNLRLCLASVNSTRYASIKF